MKILKSGFISYTDIIKDKWFTFTRAQHLALPNTTNLDKWQEENIKNWKKINNTNNKQNLPLILRLDDNNTKFCGCIDSKLVLVYKIECELELEDSDTEFKSETLYFALNLEKFIKILVQIWCTPEISGLLNQKTQNELLPLISILNKVYIAQLNPITHQLWSNSELKTIIEAYIKITPETKSNAEEALFSLGIYSPDYDEYNHKHTLQAGIRNKTGQMGSIGYYFYAIAGLAGVSIPYLYPISNILFITNAIFQSIKIFNTDGMINTKQLSNLSMLFMLTSHTCFFDNLELIQGDSKFGSNIREVLDFGHLDLNFFEHIGLASKQETVGLIDKVYRFITVPIYGVLTGEDNLKGIHVSNPLDKNIKDTIEEYITYFELEIFKPEIRNKINEYYTQIQDVHEDYLLEKLKTCNFSGDIEHIPKILENLKSIIERHKELDVINRVVLENDRQIKESNAIIKRNILKKKENRKLKIYNMRKQEFEAFEHDKSFAQQTGISVPKIFDVSKISNNPSDKEWSDYYMDKGLSSNITPKQLILLINSTFGPNCGNPKDFHNCISEKNTERARNIIDNIRDMGGLYPVGGKLRKKSKKNRKRNNRKTLKNRKRNLKSPKYLNI